MTSLNEQKAKEVRKAKRKLAKRFHGDDPQAMYDCPVCHHGVPLENVVNHLQPHYKNGEIGEHNADEVYGLEYVAGRVLNAYRERLRRINDKYNGMALSAAKTKTRTRLVSGGLPSLGKRR